MFFFFKYISFNKSYFQSYKSNSNQAKTAFEVSIYTKYYTSSIAYTIQRNRRFTEFAAFLSSFSFFCDFFFCNTMQHLVYFDFSIVIRFQLKRLRTTNQSHTKYAHTLNKKAKYLISKRNRHRHSEIIKENKRHSSKISLLQ